MLSRHRQVGRHRGASRRGWCSVVLLVLGLLLVLLCVLLLLPGLAVATSLLPSIAPALLLAVLLLVLLALLVVHCCGLLVLSLLLRGPGTVRLPLPAALALVRVVLGCLALLVLLSLLLPLLLLGPGPLAALRIGPLALALLSSTAAWLPHAQCCHGSHGCSIGVTTMGWCHAACMGLLTSMLVALATTTTTAPAAATAAPATRLSLWTVTVLPGCVAHANIVPEWGSCTRSCAPRSRCVLSLRTACSLREQEARERHTS